MTDEKQTVKVSGIMGDTSRSRFRRYRDAYYGSTSLAKVLFAEFVILPFSGMPGALGLWLRSKLYPILLARTGRHVVFGRNVVIRHGDRIRIGNNVVVDDNCVLDAKGGDGAGITIEDNVYIGRNTIVYCKGGRITLRNSVNLSSFCQVMSSNELTIGEGCMIGAYSYFLSGGEYDYRSPVKFCEQTGMQTRGPLHIGDNCWLGAHVTVVDGASIGKHCVIGAGAVVTQPLPPDSLAFGIPACVVKNIS